MEGNPLNPILQDPSCAIHPPFLYSGYVGLSVVFSLAVAALIEGRVDAAWARWVRPWALAAWSFLTVGITLGSFWAYYELGWGGWWAGTRWRTPASCPGWRPRPCCIRRS